MNLDTECILQYVGIKSNRFSKTWTFQHSKMQSNTCEDTQKKIQKRCGVIPKRLEGVTFGFFLPSC